MLRGSLCSFYSRVKKLELLFLATISLLLFSSDFARSFWSMYLFDELFEISYPRFLLSTRLYSTYGCTFPPYSSILPGELSQGLSSSL